MSLVGWESTGTSLTAKPIPIIIRPMIIPNKLPTTNFRRPILSMKNIVATVNMKLPAATNAASQIASDSLLVPEYEINVAL